MIKYYLNGWTNVIEIQTRIGHDKHLINATAAWEGFPHNIYWGISQTQELIYNNCVFILTCLNFSHLQSTLHLMQHTYWDILSTVQNSFELIDFDAF